jgi:tetratricopeptide (TPR) repeat protein
MRNVASALACLTLVAAAACAPRLAPLPTVTAPRFPDFVAPTVPAAFAGSAATERQLRGWTFLQAGDLRNAEREFTAALDDSLAFYPAEIGLGYVDLAGESPKEALSRFDGVLMRQPGEVSALVGRGEASLALGSEAEALASFEAAVAANPALTEVAQRVAILRFRQVGRLLADARAAARAGRTEEAVRAYTTAIAGSPGSAFLYRELAAVERERGNDEAALGHYRTAVDLDPGDGASLLGIGEILEARGDLEGALKMYADALALEPGAEVRAGLEAARARAELARLPVEYREIGRAAEITRGELAALIGVRLMSLLESAQTVDAAPITDVRASWAAPWILEVARTGVIAPFANHAFEPDTIVRRAELARAVERLLERIAVVAPAQSRSWQSATVPFTDLAEGHLAYPAAAVAVASGVLAAEPDGRFEPFRTVSGQEAVAAIERIEALAGLPSPGRTER